MGRGRGGRAGGSRRFAAALPPAHPRILCCFGAGCAASLAVPSGATLPCGKQGPTVPGCGEGPAPPTRAAWVFIVFSCDSCKPGGQNASRLPALLLISTASQASSRKRHFLCVAGGTESFSMATRPAAGRMRPTRMLCQRGCGCLAGKGGFSGSPWGAGGREGAARLQQLVAQPARRVLCRHTDGVGRLALV